MKANYHTHTYRCHHAFGSEWEYVEKAIEAGIKTLGFADHTPYPFPDGYRSRVRMLPEQLAHYIETIEKLRKLYGDRIELLCGLETEYYPDLFPAYLEMLRETPGVQYLILSQHFYGNEYDTGLHMRLPVEDEELLARYVDQVIAGMETGRFLYVGHPDLRNFVGDLEIYRKHMRRLCQASIRTDTPLEINLLGYREQHWYPRADFWEVAGEEGCTAILGSDAHRPEHIYNAEHVAELKEMARKYDLKLVEELPLKKDFLK